jgi:hypothetical protein
MMPSIISFGPRRAAKTSKPSLISTGKGDEPPEFWREASRNLTNAGKIRTRVLKKTQALVHFL